MAHQKVTLRKAWMKSRAARDSAKMLDLARQILTRRPDDMLIVQSTARFLLEYGRAEDSLVHWRTVLDTDPANLEAAYHVRTIAPDDPCLATLGERAHQMLDAARDAIAASPSAKDTPHLLICGVSFCGSTLFDRLLAGLPGTRSIGESHYLTKHRLAKKQFDEISLNDDLDAINLVPCSVCGRSCEVLTDTFRLGLAADRRNWYGRIAAQMGADILVSADKNMPKILANDPSLRFDGLVIFKSPEQAWRSKLNKLPQDQPAAYYVEECKTYLDVWTNSYRGFLDDLKPDGQLVFLNFDAFTQAPETLFKTLCARLNLPYDPSVLSRTIPGHAIGGNHGSMTRLRDADYNVRIETLPPADLDREFLDMIAAHTDLQDTYKRLMERHHALSADALSAPRPTPSGPTPVPPAEATPGPDIRMTVTPVPLPAVKNIHILGVFGKLSDVLDVEIAKQEAKGTVAKMENARFFKHLKANLDHDAFARMQTQELTPPGLDPTTNRNKYIDPVVWFRSKLAIARRIKLAKRPRMNILDIGTGPCHWPAVAQFYGHSVLGTDLPDRTDEDPAQPHLYDKLAQIYGVRRKPLTIQEYEKLPDFGQRFDMVTAFLAAFNVNIHRDRAPWSIDAWTFFMHDLRENVLTEQGELVMSLTRDKLTDDVWAYLSARAETFDDQQKYIHFTDLSKF